MVTYLELFTFCLVVITAIELFCRSERKKAARRSANSHLTSYRLVNWGGCRCSSMPPGVVIRVSEFANTKKAGEWFLMFPLLCFARR